MFTNHRWQLALAAVITIAFLVSWSSAFAEQKGPNVQVPKPETRAETRPGAEAVGKLQTALKLIEFGRVHHSPSSMVAAAEMIAQLSLTPLNQEPTRKSDQKGQPLADKQRKPRAETLDPIAFLDEALSMTGSEPAMKDYIERTKTTIRSTRGAVGGAKYRWAKVSAYSSDWYNVRFYGGQWAKVGVSGDGDTDLDLYIYDESGNCVASDDSPIDDCYAQWVPSWTATYSIRVLNRGAVYNQYLIVTN